MNWHGKRYYSFDSFLKNYFGEKIYKVSLDGGFTCPNRDGTLGTGGCIFCSEGGSGDFASSAALSVTDQITAGIEMVSRKIENGKYIAYFQAHTNTYAPVSVLKEKYESVLNIDDVIGIAIATRADCISDECLNYLKELNKKTFLSVELGLQTIHDDTAKLINRCHTLKQFEDTYKKLKNAGIEVVVHIINGLPFENEDMMLETAKYINKIDVDGVKIHMLNIVKDTALEKLYKQTGFHLLTKDEYIDIVIKQLELLNEDIVIHRITSDPDPKNLVAPDFLVKKFCLLNDIDKEMKKRDTYQGIKVSSK